MGASCSESAEARWKDATRHYVATATREAKIVMTERTMDVWPVDLADDLLQRLRRSGAPEEWVAAIFKTPIETKRDLEAFVEILYDAYLEQLPVIATHILVCDLEARIIKIVRDAALAARGMEDEEEDFGSMTLKMARIELRQWMKESVREEIEAAPMDSEQPKERDAAAKRQAFARASSLSSNLSSLMTKASPSVSSQEASNASQGKEDGALDDRNAERAQLTWQQGYRVLERKVKQVARKIHNQVLHFFHPMGPVIQQQWILLLDPSNSGRLDSVTFTSRALYENAQGFAAMSPHVTDLQQIAKHQFKRLIDIVPKLPEQMGQALQQAVEEVMMTQDQVRALVSGVNERKILQDLVFPFACASPLLPPMMRVVRFPSALKDQLSLLPLPTSLDEANRTLVEERKRTVGLLADADRMLSLERLHASELRKRVETLHKELSTVLGGKDPFSSINFDDGEVPCAE